MEIDYLRIAPAAVYALLLVVAAAYDVIQRRIPNWTVIALIAVFAVAAIMGVTTANVWWSLAGFGVALAVGVGLYLMGWIGAGDAKLFAATALFGGLGNLLTLAALTTISGGLLALALLIARPKAALRGLTAQGRAESKGRGVPYGVAIAFGGLATAVLTQFLWPHQQLTHIDLSPIAPITPASPK